MESEPDIRTKKTQSRTNYAGAGGTGGCGKKKRMCELKVLEAEQILVIVDLGKPYGRLAKVSWDEGLRNCEKKKTRGYSFR